MSQHLADEGSPCGWGSTALSPRCPCCCRGVISAVPVLGWEAGHTLGWAGCHSGSWRVLRCLWESPALLCPALGRQGARGLSHRSCPQRAGNELDKPRGQLWHWGMAGPRSAPGAGLRPLSPQAEPQGPARPGPAKGRAAGTAPSPNADFHPAADGNAPSALKYE